MSKSQHDDVLDSMYAVLQEEIDALEKVKMSLDETYVYSVEALHQCQGKIVITGIGKSGLIAQKISATLSSTGSPSYFIHATEALHGDMGAIRKGDVVVFYSKSGNTREVLNLIVYLKQLDIHIVGVFCNPNGIPNPPANLNIKK